MLEMLKKKLGIEGIERDWKKKYDSIYNFYKIPSTLIIPEGCGKIGRGVFEGCDWLKKVVISEGVLWIRSFAFGSCSRLKEVVIPGSVDWIGNFAFKDCNNATIILKKPEKDFEAIGEKSFYSVRDVKEEVRN